MDLAIQEAKKGAGYTSPNPRVGAVLVKNRRILARGYHAKFGGPHAEISALNKAGANLKNATLYLTLEPCSTFGKTPPCTQAILASRVSKVVIGSLDPNPIHFGKGVRILKKSGIEIISGVLDEECRELNLGFNKWISMKMPYCIIKSGLSLDGKIATSKGESQWITNSLSLKYGYRLRSESDAVMVGIETVLKDNPSLSLHGQKGNEPFKIIVDSRGRLPVSSKLVRNFAKNTILAVTTISSSKEKYLTGKGIKIIKTSAQKNRVNLISLFKNLAALGITSILVEGGGELAASVIQNRLADRLYYFFAPVLIGGKKAKQAFAGEGYGYLKHVPRLQNLKIKRLDSDILISGDIKY